MIERFSVRIATPSEREKALNRIFQAALLHRIAVVSCLPRGNGLRSRSVIVVDAEAESEWLNDIIDLERNRLVGIYAKRDSTHADLLAALTEDLETLSHE